MATEKKNFIYVPRLHTYSLSYLITVSLNSNAVFVPQSAEDSTTAAADTGHFTTVC